MAEVKPSTISDMFYPATFCKESLTLLLSSSAIGTDSELEFIAKIVMALVNNSLGIKTVCHQPYLSQPASSIRSHGNLTAGLEPVGPVLFVAGWWKRK